MSNIEIIVDDATKLSKIKNNSIDLIVTAPPFINKDPEFYGGNPLDQINYNSKKMLNLLIKSTKQMERVLKDTGSIWIEICPDESLIHRYVVDVLKKTNLYHVDTIIHQVKDYEDLFIGNSIKKEVCLTWLHFVKNPRNFYYDEFKVKKYNLSVWNLDLSNKNDIVEKELRDKYPEVSNYSSIGEIPKRFIEMFTKKGHTVLDPFGGSGTVACEAYRLKRDAISCDISPLQRDIAEYRIEIEKSFNV